MINSTTKSGRGITSKQNTTKKVFAARICTYCDHVNKIKWDIDADKDGCEIVVPTNIKIKLFECDYCSHILHSDLICGEDAVSERLIDDLKSSMYKQSLEKFNAEVNEIIEKTEHNLCIETTSENANIVKNHPEHLKKYVYYAVKVESAVRFYEELLINLKMELQNGHKKFVIDSVKESKKQKNHAKASKKEIEALEDKIQAIEDNFEKTDFSANVKLSKIKKPAEPTYISIAEITAPVYPQLKKPGLFNRKKVEEENAALIAEYNAQHALYLAECEKNAEIEQQNSVLKEKYEKKLLEYKEKQKQQKQEIQENAELLKEEARKEKDLEIAKIRQKIEDLRNEKTVKNLENTIALFIGNEITRAENQLVAAVQARANFYAYNIIYPKYRNYVAVTKFCEYLESERCSSLEGANGAYNLYEAECMNNIIVSQLAVISDKLDDIKNNQLLMYSELKAINHNLLTLNNTMKKAVSKIDSLAVSMSDMKSYLADISANTRDIKDINSTIAKNTAISAYYSEVNAHYAKLNCELTDALGFMVAFK